MVYENIDVNVFGASYILPNQILKEILDRKQLITFIRLFTFKVSIYHRFLTFYLSDQISLNPFVICRTFLCLFFVCFYECTYFVLIDLYPDLKQQADSLFSLFVNQCSFFQLYYESLFYYVFSVLVEKMSFVVITCSNYVFSKSSHHNKCET